MRLSEKDERIFAFILMEKRKRGRPKGSKNKPKVNVEPKRKRGRPKGSKNKPKQGTEKRAKPGRPRKPVDPWKKPEGVSFVARKRSQQSDTHRWVAVIDNEVIGYYKTLDAASQAIDKAKG